MTEEENNNNDDEDAGKIHLVVGLAVPVGSHVGILYPLQMINLFLWQVLHILLIFFQLLRLIGPARQIVSVLTFSNCQDKISLIIQNIAFVLLP